MTQITNKPHIQSKSKIHEVTPKGNGIFQVTSGSSSETYLVALREHGATCTCPWGQYRKWSDPSSGCSHVVAAFRFSLKEQGRLISVWTSPEDAKRQHRHQIGIGDGVILTTRKKEIKPRRSEYQILKELGF